MNAAGIATAEVWRECLQWALATGARQGTFDGLAGIGDLTATIIAPQSRNRQAGELLGQGTPATQIPAIIGQASEGLDSVPLIAETVAESGIEAPGLNGLASLISGDIDASEWLARLRRVERARRAA
jgi:glycerol-3-phosphate dehydrogenase (NAD(P)+)